jgi:hypothetical protein
MSWVGASTSEANRTRLKGASLRRPFLRGERCRGPLAHQPPPPRLPITVSGPTQAYVRGTAISFHFCPACGCVAFWRSQNLNEDGRRRIAVNLRLTEPQAVAQIPIDHFDGLDSFEDLPRDGRCVADYWF